MNRDKSLYSKWQDISKKKRSKYDYVNKLISEWARYNKDKNIKSDKLIDDRNNNSSDDEFNSGDEFYKKKNLNEVQSFLSSEKGPIVKLELDKIENEMSLK